MKTYLRISAALFGLIAFVHLLRLLLHWSAVVADRAVPAWISLVAVAVSASLSFWGLRLLRVVGSAA